MKCRIQRFAIKLGIALLACFGLLGTGNSALAATPMVAAGVHYALALKADGSVSAWGRNDSGQLGNGQAALRSTPTQVAGIDRATSVTAGADFSLALRDDGTVWAWGLNVNGMLGDGSTQSKSHPVPVTGLQGQVVKAITAGYFHSLALTTDGKVWAWGYGGEGQLGNGEVGDRITATLVGSLPSMVALAAGGFHSLALASDGQVWAWGDNRYGQLGNGNTTRSLTPARVPNLTNIVAISTTGNSNLALDGLGRVWAWGKGGWGALGDGTYNNRSTPFVVPGLPKVKAVFAGNLISVATTQDGSVWIWGDNEVGQFGSAKYTRQPSPLTAPHLAGLSQFSIGNAHILAQRPGGSWLAWGMNDKGQLGLGDLTDRPTPTAIGTNLGWLQISAGAQNTIAVASDGTVWAWGANGGGQLADGTVNVNNSPGAVLGLPPAVAVTAGPFHALALDSDGGVWAWGGNGNGALGNGSRRDSSLALRVPGLPTMAALAAGHGFSLALTASGEVWSWGDGPNGELGVGQIGTTLYPIQLTTIASVKQLSTSNQHVLALRQDGSVWGWGNNRFGQLGDGSSTNRSAPVPVSGLQHDIKAVAAGSFHSLALDASGAVWAWGYNYGGQLGDGGFTDRNTPVLVQGLSGVVGIAAGHNTSYAVTRDGRLWAWGWNFEGELGIGSTADLRNPVPRSVPGLDGFVGIAGGVGSAVALRSDGSVWAWGRNFEGQLGDATFAQHTTPVLTLNANADGPLDLNPALPKTIPPDKLPKFFTAASRYGDLSQFSLTTRTKFNATDVGRTGSVFITAKVPASSPGLLQKTLGFGSASKLATRATTTAGDYVLMQLTATGWQPVVNGKLIPYASGVLGESLAAQSILDATDVSALAGAEFCLGYGSNADEMNAAGRMRAVATIVTDNPSGGAPASCLTPWAIAASNRGSGARDVTLELAFTPSQIDSAGGIYQIYLGGLLGGQYYFLTPDSVVPYNGGALPVYRKADASALAGQPVLLPFGDISALHGLQLFTGFGLDEQDMLNKGQVKAVFNVE